MSLILGCIADDFTGGTDLANNLVRAGMRTVQVIGVPDHDNPGAAPDCDAVVVALKSRTAAVAEAVAQSRAAAHWLRREGATQIYFKVCSTFDSTPHGNIGPVAEALMDELGADFAVVTPAFPENARTVFKGHLFVGDQLLSDSPMKHHPLTPMTDANLVRVLQAQLDPARGRRVGLIDYRCVAQGAAAIGQRIGALREQGFAFAIADALSDDDLRRLADASAALPLVVAGSGLAIGIPARHGLQPDAQAAKLPPPGGAAAVLSGSCSAATNAQVAAFIAGGGEALAVDPLRLAAGHDAAAEALAWARPRLDARRALLVYATAAPEAVRAVQQQLGAEHAGALVEQALSRIAVGLVEAGVGRLVVAGGETSGACVQALGIAQLRIGTQIDPGVPWCHAATPLRREGLHLALKSGNFGGSDFFSRAFGLP
ncbi:MAG: four-carbon acid sugar kinase family protein [Burkholderiaceae bacterium]|nr:four-carbon acid sugar kinase family protein [Burkholderiaceae bacterium]